MKNTLQFLNSKFYTTSILLVIIFCAIITTNARSIISPFNFLNTPDIITTGVITGSTAMCEGNSATIHLSITGISGGTYQLLLNSVPLAGTSVVVTGYDYDWQVTQAGTYTCQGTVGGNPVAFSGSVTITVSPLPTVGLSPFANISVFTSPFSLSGGSPSGGTYFGQGVINNMFYPANVGPGTYTITYSYMNPFGCVGSASSMITVNYPPTPYYLSGGGNYCLGQAGSACLDGSQAGVTYHLYLNGNFLTGTNQIGTGMPMCWSINQSGTYTCLADDGISQNLMGGSAIFQFNPLPSVSLSTFASVSASGAPFALSGGSPTGGTYSGQGVSNNVFSPASVGAGTYNITYAYMDASGCMGSASANIVVAAASTSQIAGYVRYNNSANTSMAGVTVTLLTNSMTVIESTVTNAQGYYSFINVQNGLYKLSASNCTIPWSNSVVTARDCLRILQHYIGISSIGGFSLFAADINGNSSVNALDAELLKNRIGTTTTSFPTSDWRYEMKDINFTGQSTPVILLIQMAGDVNSSF